MRADVLHTRDSQLNVIMTYVRDPSWTGIERNVVGDATDDDIASLDIDDIIRLIVRQHRRRHRHNNCSTSPVTSSTLLPRQQQQQQRQRNVSADDVVIDETERSWQSVIRRRRLLHSASATMNDVISGRMSNDSREFQRSSRPACRSAASTADGGVRSEDGEEAEDEDEEEDVYGGRHGLTESEVRERVDRLHQVAHGLHYASIVILGLLVVEVYRQVLPISRCVGTSLRFNDKCSKIV